MELPEPVQPFSDTTNQLKNLKNGIREIAHDINNPLGIVRMAVYFLLTANPTSEKRDQYFRAIEGGLERIEQNLQRLKALGENPAIPIPHSPPEDR